MLKTAEKLAENEESSPTGIAAGTLFREIHSWHRLSAHDIVCFAAENDYDRG
jgi:hypothetical protein